MNQNTFKRYIWLIDTVYKAENEGITFEDIRIIWQSSDLYTGKIYPLRTFHNHRKEIKDIFNISIRCHKTTNKYYVDDTGQSSQVLKKILELVSVNQLFNDSTELLPHLYLELRPGGECYLSKIMAAIAQSRQLTLEYKPYWSEKLIRYPFFAPYAIKEYKGSWFLLGRRGENPCEMIDLKKVTSMTTLPDEFSMPPLSEVQSLLHDNYGSVIEDMETEEILIKVGARFAAYLSANQLHPTQKEIEKRRNYSIFYFYLKPNSDFRREILSFGTSMEVLNPDHLRVALTKDARTFAKKNSK